MIAIALRTPEAHLAAMSIPEPNSGCILWIGYRDKDGYGSISHNNQRVKAHRFAYTLARGPIPGGMVIDHLCRNTACVNPGHMEVVTDRENILRGVGLAAKNRQKTHCPRGHPYDSLDKTTGQRICMECKRVHDNTSARKRRRRASA